MSSPCAARKTELNRCEAIKRRTIAAAKSKSWCDFMSFLDRGGSPRAFWGFSRAMLGRAPPSSNSSFPLLNHIGDRLSSDALKAEAFRSHYLQADMQAADDRDETGLLERVANGVVSVSPMDAPFTIGELSAALKGLRGRSMGSDLVHNLMLQNLSPANRLSLLRLFNLFFASGFVPAAWKVAVVIPTLKPGKDPALPVSYRPISLTSCAC